MSCRKSIIVINVGINGKDMKQLVVLLLIAVAGIASISCNGKKRIKGKSSIIMSGSICPMLILIMFTSNTGRR